MKLHVEGPDADLMMGMIDGMGTLRITDDNGHIAKLNSYTAHDVWINPESFFGKRNGVAFVRTGPLWHPCSLWCNMAAAMRGMGWTGKMSGHNSITVDAFIGTLRKCAADNNWAVNHIGYLD